VAAYAPLGSEPGGPDLPLVLAAAGVRVLLPVLLPDNDLDWAVFEGGLTTGRRGLAEPTGPRLGVEGIRAADLVLVPALAVDHAGRRMGRGGGSYDRALARVGGLPRPSSGADGSSADGSSADGSSADGLSRPAGPLLVALLHDGELIESVPAEPHDRPVHGALLPTGGFVGFF
jgi:5-formyltetrahydrofolate cyclo-ligase